MLKQVATLAAWVASSSALIFVNKALYNESFAFPLMATAIGQSASVVCGFGMAHYAAVHEPAVSNRRPASPVLLGATVVATVGTLYLGNAAYMHLSVAFIQMLKGFTPCLTLAFAILSGREQCTPLLIIAVAAISFGTVISSISEAAHESFSWIGSVLMLLSSVTEALRSVFVQQLTASHATGFTLRHAMVWISLPSAICLGLFSAVFEPRALSKVTDLFQSRPLLLFAVAGLSAATNLTGYASIKVRSGFLCRAANSHLNM
jgi:drug/metabolite transporter (DMT)-like permease